jgi:predicted ATPase
VPRPVLTKGLRSQGYKENTLFNQVVTGLYSFERAIRRITALGAFRAAPIRSYQYTGASNFETDLSGELSAQRIFRAISSNSFENRTFLKALAFWMTRLVGYKIDEHAASESFRGMFSIYLKDTYARNSFNFADVGFGVSQAMPILIAGLSSRRGDVLLIQQPELHLHPDAQIAMADFLLFLAQSGRQVIAETHSEHMILRTRVALADSSKDYQSDLVKLQIFSRAKGSQQTKRVEVNFDSIGTASAWPTGFFEQATEQRMILLKHQAKYLQNIKG